MSAVSGDLIIVTGMTGAGRSTAAKALEDIGWFVIDNLPPSMLPAVVEMLTAEDDEGIKIAVVVDVRSRGFFADLRGAMATMDGAGHAAAGALPRGVGRRAGQAPGGGSASAPAARGRPAPRRDRP